MAIDVCYLDYRGCKNLKIPTVRVIEDRNDSKMGTIHPSVKGLWGEAQSLSSGMFQLLAPKRCRSAHVLSQVLRNVAEGCNVDDVRSVSISRGRIISHREEAARARARRTTLDFSVSVVSALGVDIPIELYHVPFLTLPAKARRRRLSTLAPKMQSFGSIRVANYTI